MLLLLVAACSQTKPTAGVPPLMSTPPAVERVIILHQPVPAVSKKQLRQLKKKLDAVKQGLKSKNGA